MFVDTEKDWLVDQLHDNEFTSILLQNSPNPIWIAKADMSLVYINPALEKLTLFSLKDVVGYKPPYPWWPEENMRKCMRDWHEAISRGLRRREEVFSKKNGELFTVEITSTSVKRNGKLAYYLSSWVDITQEKKLRENIQFYITEITKAQEEERKRIARELHDETVQELASICVEVGKILISRDKASDLLIRLENIPTRIESLVEGLRRFSHNLRPGLLDKFGMVSSLELLADEIRVKDNLDCVIEVIGDECRLSPDVETVLFRIAQEAISNAKRHSHATSVLVRLHFCRKRFILTINDNGCGFRVPKVVSNLARSRKLGLIGMTERARLIGAKLSIQSRVDAGTTIKVTLPA